MAETELDERDLPATSIVYLTTTGPLVSSGPAAPLDVISTCREASCVAPFSLNSTPQNAAAPLHRRRCHRDHASDCFRVGPIVSSFRDRSIIDAFIWSGWLSSRSIPILWEFFSASCCGEHGQNGYSRIGPPLARIDERYYLLTSRHGSAAIRLDLKGKWRGGGGRREARLEAPCALERNVRPTRPRLGGGRSKGLETNGTEHSPPPPPAILGGEPRRCLSPTPNARLVRRSTTRAEGGEMSWTHKSTKRSPLRRVISQSEKRMNESLASFVSRGVMRRLVGRSARLETATTTTNGADPRVAR